MQGLLKQESKRPGIYPALQCNGVNTFHVSVTVCIPIYRAMSYMDIWVLRVLNDQHPAAVLTTNYRLGSIYE